MSLTPRPIALLAAAVVFAGTAAHAQATAPALRPVPRPGSSVSLALTYDAQASNITNTNRFWLQGGAAELNAEVLHGLGLNFGVLGLHTADSGGGVPINLLVTGIGPSYTHALTRHGRSVGFFAHGLVGEANGFRGLYPRSGGADKSASSLAVQAGGGVDLGLSRHLALRLLQADYIRTQLPNALTNVQNSLRLGAGLVLR